MLHFWFKFQAPQPLISFMMSAKERYIGLYKQASIGK